MPMNKDIYKKIGIIGGGQLGLMLAEATLKTTGRKPIFFVDSATTPAQSAGYTTTDSLENFLSQVELVLIENEWIPVEKLNKLKSQFPKVRFWPKLESLTDLRNKKSQKFFLQTNNIPTAPFRNYNSSATLNGSVLKRGSHAYDGTGNFAVPPGETYSPEKLAQFIKSCEPDDLYIEDFVHFDAEVALVCGVRHLGNHFEFFHYPLVQTVQSKNVCEWVQPIPSFFKKFETQAIAIAKKIADQSQIEGVFAVEFFITSSGELLVNEIAPRVHNSGHFTRVACKTSQFDLQIKLALGLPVQSDELKTTLYFGMLNLLGDQIVNTSAIQMERFEVKDYLKKQSRPGRKMGHITFATEDSAQFESLRKTLFLKDSST